MNRTIVAALLLALACASSVPPIPTPQPTPVPTPTPTPQPDPQAAGSWVNVTPANADLTDALSCDNYGVHTVVVDPLQPTDFYAHFYCQGTWRSRDSGLTWTGPINATSATKDCAGGITIAPGTPGTPILYESCIRGTGSGFWRSTDGGVNWTKFTVAPGGARQDFYPAVVDPYDPNHLLMAGHEMNMLVESSDGGQTWRGAPMDPAMNPNGGTGGIFFIDMGAAATTRAAWLWIAQQSGGNFGTWRTTTSGTSWTQVDKNEHPHGAAQVFEPGAGVLYMGGAYSGLGWGVLRSSDYGQTWQHVGSTQNLSAVWGTPSAVYAGLGWADGLGTSDPPHLELAPVPGTGTWTQVAAPGGMIEGPGSVAVGSGASGRVFIGAMFQAGLWRYVEAR